MGIFDVLKTIASGIQKNQPGSSGVIPYGRQKDNGGHDSRTNKGNDRTVAQREGDKKRRGPRG